MRKRVANNPVWYVFLIPALSVLLFFMAYPIVECFRLSFFKSNGVIESFTGMRNYVRVFTSYEFWRSVYVTFYLSFFKLLIAIPLGFVVAYLINDSPYCRNLLKVVYFIPYITSVVAAGMVFLFVLHPGEGLLNTFLGWFGIKPVAWLAKATSAKWGTIFLMVWHWLGFVVIVSMANLQTIPPELYEAATIDGAKKNQTFFRITIPMMKNCFGFLIVMGWIEGLKTFTEPYILGRGNGSPGGALFTVTGYIYNHGFMGTEFGIASAASIILFLIIFLLTWLNMKTSKTSM